MLPGNRKYKFLRLRHNRYDWIRLSSCSFFYFPPFHFLFRWHSSIYASSRKSTFCDFLWSSKKDGKRLAFVFPFIVKRESFYLLDCWAMGQEVNEKPGKSSRHRQNIRKVVKNIEQILFLFKFSHIKVSLFILVF